ncbi:MAG TPA: carboxypeptidase-like regulatory domain-containing protein, partial [Myxococcales bacterium]
MRKLVILGVLLAAAWLFWPRETGPASGSAEGRAKAALHAQTASTGSAQLAPGGQASAAPLDAAEADSPAGTTPKLAQPATAADGFIELCVTANGKPFPGAEVKLYLRGHADRATGKIDWRLAGAAQTSAAGQARLPARPGSYLVSARAHGFATAHRNVQRPEGEALTKAAVELQPGLALTGRTVQKGEKEPVPLAVVTLVQEEGPSRGRGARRGARSAMFGGPRAPGEAPVEEQLHATSNEQGRFRIEGIEPGAYVITAVATGFAKAAETVTLPAADEVVLQLAQSSFIEGSVVTSDGKAAAGAAIIASGGRDPVAGVATESGTFSIEVSPRIWELTAKKGEETGRADAPVSVAAGATARGIRIKLGPAASIAGTVVAAANQAPIAGAQIALSPHDADGASGLGQTDGNGAFTISGLAPGSYDAVVSAQGYTDASYRGLTVTEGQKFPFKALLHQTGTLQGFVNDSGGHGVPNALVRTLPGFGQEAAQPQEARADANGAYTLSGVAAGHVQLTALRDGSTLGTTATADLAEGGTARVDFQLHDEGMVTGHVRRADGSLPPAGATVNAAPSDNRFMRSDWAAIPIDQTGAYVATLPAGAYSLGVNGASGAGRRFGNRGFTTVEAGKSAVLDLVYADADDPSAGFSGVVLEPGGTPSPGAFVRGTSGSGRGGFVFGAMTDESGRFQSNEARGDLPDTFQVVGINGGRTGIAQVAEGQAQVTVQLQPGGVINGHLVSGPVDQFRVDLTLAQGSALGGGGPSAAQSLQFSGDRFSLHDVPGTKVHVTVTTQDGRSAAQDVSLSPGGEADIEVPLEPLSTVTGRLTDSVTQSPISGGTVFLDQPRGTSAP